MFSVFMGTLTCNAQKNEKIENWVSERKTHPRQGIKNRTLNSIILQFIVFLLLPSLLTIFAG